MGAVEFELQRTVRAPIADVFARLVDSDGYDAWMPRRGSIRRGSRQTSPGAPGAGSTFVDDTLFGATPGEIVEFRAPETVVFHWWDTGRSGRCNAEGWPGYALEQVDDTTTLVRHHARLRTYRHYRPATPVLRLIALRERRAVLDALEASFDGPPPSLDESG